MKTRFGTVFFCTALFITLLAVVSCGGGGGGGGGGNPSPAAPVPPAPPPITSFEGGTAYRMAPGAGLNILVLSGTWHEMGRQYGALMGDQMEAYYQTFASVTPPLDYVHSMFDALEQRDQDLIAGMAETTGFSLDKQETIATYVSLAFINMEYGCSQMAVWGPYTTDGHLIQARNWDLTGFSEFQPYVTVVVYNPSDSPNAFVEVNFAGTVGLTHTAMNSRGVYFATNSAVFSDPSFKPDQKAPTFFLEDILLSCTSISDFDALLDPANLLSAAENVNVSDPSGAAVYECATYDAKKRTGNGVIASTDHFIDPAWSGLPALVAASSGDSQTRLANLLNLAERYKGSIDEQRMRDIFDMSKTAGGATLPGYTIFRVVATPATQVIWVKAPGYSDWQEIALAPLFQK